MKKKLTVFQSSRFFNDRGGAQSCFIALHRLLKQHGHKVPLLTGTHSDNFKSEYSDYFVPRYSQDNIHNIGFKGAVTAAMNSIYALDVHRNTKKIVSRYKPDIADVHNIYYQISPSVFGPLYKADIPIIHHLHDYAMFCVNGVCEVNDHVCTRCRKKRYHNAIVNRCYQHSSLRSMVGALSKIVNNSFGTYDPKITKYIVTSDFQRDFLAEWGVDPYKMEVLPLFFDGADYPKFSVAEKEPIILFFGEMKPRKGPQLVYEIAKRIPEIHFVFAGRGPLRKELSLRAKADSISNVTFYDYLSKEILFDILSKSLMTIVPSIFNESFGRVIIESFYYGCPVIGSRIGSIPEVITEGQTGYTFEPGNVEDLYEKIKYLLDNGSHREELGINAKADVQKRYSKELYYRNLMRIYNKAI